VRLKHYQRQCGSTLRQRWMGCIRGGGPVRCVVVVIEARACGEDKPTQPLARMWTSDLASGIPSESVLAAQMR